MRILRFAYLFSYLRLIFLYICLLWQWNNLLFTNKLRIKLFSLQVDFLLTYIEMLIKSRFLFLSIKLTILKHRVFLRLRNFLFDSFLQLFHPSVEFNIKFSTNCSWSVGLLKLTGTLMSKSLIIQCIWSFPQFMMHSHIIFSIKSLKSFSDIIIRLIMMTGSNCLIFMSKRCYIMSKIISLW